MANEAYKFPDQIGIDGPGKKDESEFKIEVVDDTPEADKGRQPLPDKVKKELDEDDLSAYSDQVQSRLKALKKAWHDERREKEASKREREEALKFAEIRERENKELRQKLGDGEKIFVTEVTNAAKTQLEAARNKLKQAYEAGDAGELSLAQEALTEALLKSRDISKFKPTPLDEKDESVVQRTSQATAQPAPDPKAEAWRSKNTWFGSDEEMTATALGLHQKLLREGINPTSDEYYDRINKRIRKLYPESFEDSTQDEPAPPKARSEPTPRAPTVVASASRSTAPREVRLTATEARVAKSLGVSLEQYAREKMKTENPNGY
jgi:hypothetical protein